ncbi:DUF2568 domain-containing protein [Albidovulum sp.]|uniref:DUF2568 domain-containing protein n=1 Tax=Albidovulum sp. TaxID=1872424 RepID=UPI003D7DA8D6
MALAATHALAFAVEAWLVWAVGRWGFGLGGAPVAGWALALACGAAAITLWGRFAAPRSLRRLRGGALLSFKIGAFAAGAAATLQTYGAIPAAGYLILSLAQLVLALRQGAL